MNIELVTFLMFGTMLILIALGLPIAFCLGAVGVVFAFFAWGPDYIGIVFASIWAGMKNYLMIAVPLFIFMSYILETSGIADDLYLMMHRWFGPLRGGLAIGTVVILIYLKNNFSIVRKTIKVIGIAIGLWLAADRIIFFDAPFFFNIPLYSKCP